MTVVNCKLHVIPANTDDRDPLHNASFIEKIRGKLWGDKGYIDKRLFDFLFIDGA